MGRTVDDFRKVLDAELKKTNGELDKLPVRIDEANRGLPAAESIDEKALAIDIESLRKDRQAKQDQLSSLETTGVSEKTKALREIEGQITDLDNKHRQKAGAEASSAQSEVDRAQSSIASLEGGIVTIDRLLAVQMTEQGDIEVMISALATQWEALNAVVWKDGDIETQCPTCGQTLPGEQVKAAHDKALADFNLAKSQGIEKIETDGTERRARVDRIKHEIEQKNREKADAKACLIEARGRLVKVQAQLNALKSQQSQPSSDPKRHQLADQQIALKEEIEQLKGGTVNPARDKLTLELIALDGTIASAERAKATADQRAKGLARIDELKAQQKALGKAFESLEFQRLLCEKFVVAKARTMTERVNSKFTLARFKLFDVQINGGISDTCEVAVNGVPYSDLNNGGRLNVGLDIIDTLSEVYGMRAPVFLDNREALSDIIPIRSQLISLWVSASDKTLRIEGGTE